MHFAAPQSLDRCDYFPSNPYYVVADLIVVWLSHWNLAQAGREQSIWVIN